MAVADEEAGSDYGAEWLDREHPELIDGAFVINEGGYGSTSFMGVERPAFGISMAEKSPLWLTLRATGRPGPWLGAARRQRARPHGAGHDRGAGLEPALHA